MRKISEIKVNPKNPRVIKDDKFEKLKKSLKEFPAMLEKRPIVVDDHGIILGGNMRFRAAQDLGYKEVPVVVFSRKDAEKTNDETGQNKTYEEYCDEFIIKDNSAFGEWDWEVLANEWDADKLSEWGLDLPSQEDVYTTKVESPVYTPKGERPSPFELYNDSKTQELLRKIDAAQVSEEEKTFLRVAAQRHTVIDFAKVAEYYAHGDTATKELMEDSALVIIDYGKAISSGFVELTEALKKLRTEDHGD